ncbi:MAG: fluoride efflux transporter CrcB [Deltaproteobacteria bacterium]|nr:fluoride efflux transporter CrcB [Deltaproteobacteria bacterium]
MKILWFAIAGASGTLARYWFGGLVQRYMGTGFPWGTFAVNMAGCFLFGLIWSLAEERLVISGQMRAVLLIGFMGAFTTFSSFVFETGALLRDSQFLMAFGNVLLQNIFGMIFLFLGFTASRLLSF